MLCLASKRQLLSKYLLPKQKSLKGKVLFLSKCYTLFYYRLACLDCALIITSGGTGLGVRFYECMIQMKFLLQPRDVTPQAILSMLESRCLGLEHLIISTGLKHTRIAALSSPIVGKIKTSK